MESLDTGQARFGARLRFRAFMTLGLLLVGVLFAPEGAQASGSFCPQSFARFSMIRLARFVPGRRVLTMLKRAGFLIKGETADGIPIIDAATFPRGGSGPVRMQIQKAKPDPELRLKLDYAAAVDDSGTAHGTLVLVRDLDSGSVVYVGVPPGYETVDPDIGGLARKALGHK